MRGRPTKNNYANTSEISAFFFLSANWPLLLPSLREWERDLRDVQSIKGGIELLSEHTVWRWLMRRIGNNALSPSLAIVWSTALSVCYAVPCDINIIQAHFWSNVICLSDFFMLIVDWSVMFLGPSQWITAFVTYLRSVEVGMKREITRLFRRQSTQQT